MLAFAVGTAAAKDDDPWQNLNQLTRDHLYTLVTRDGSCVLGTMTNVTDQTVDVRRPDKGVVTLDRGDVIRVTDGPNPFDILYSSRSAWRDVRSIPRKHDSREGARVVTRDGKGYSGGVIEVSESAITIEASGKQKAIPKSEVAQIYYMRSSRSAAGRSTMRRNWLTSRCSTRVSGPGF
jgi:preprotein translocase subunit YajC